MRDVFSKELVRLTQDDEKVILLTGDHGYALFDSFRKYVPNQFINMGIAEQNMVGVAAGLAKSGFKPIVYGLSAFVPMRVLEQIKIDVCYENLPVVFIGDGAGVVYGHLGVSHQCAEDVAVLRSLPNIEIFSPGDAYEMEYVLRKAFDFKAPTYVRVGKSDAGVIHQGSIGASQGGVIPVELGDKKSLIFFATGSMVVTALKISKAIGGIGVWSIPVIKPISSCEIIRIIAGVERVVVFEEHSRSGGLGGSLAEIISESSSSNTKVIRFGFDEKFSDKCGSYNYLIKEHGLDFETLLNIIVRNGWAT